MMKFLRFIIQLRVYRGGEKGEWEREGERMHEWGFEKKKMMEKQNRSSTFKLR
jgi:hypothetical protein